jgi:hypothetical protein
MQRTQTETTPLIGKEHQNVGIHLRDVDVGDVVGVATQRLPAGNLDACKNKKGRGSYVREKAEREATMAPSPAAEQRKASDGAAGDGERARSCRRWRARKLHAAATYPKTPWEGLQEGRGRAMEAGTCSEHVNRKP